MDRIIKETNEKISYIVSGKDALRMSEMRDMALSDYANDKNPAWREGKIEGEHKKAVEIAKKLLNRNTPIDFVVEDTGLNESEVKQLQAELDR